MKGMPVLNYRSLGCLVTELLKPSNDSPLKQDFNVYATVKMNPNIYSYEHRFVELLIPLLVHYFCKVVHGPDYIHTLKGE